MFQFFIYVLFMFSENAPANAPTRTYNVPLVTELAAILVGDFEGQNENNGRQIIIKLNNGVVKSIPSINAHYDPFGYVLYHIPGDLGWTFTLKDQKDKNLSAQDFYRYRGHFRDPPMTNLPINHDIVFYGGLLSQQYFVDQWVKTEEQRLNYIYHNQNKIRTESVQGLADAIAVNDTANLGTSKILPSSVPGSPRYMMQNYQDTMAIVAKFGKPDLFITFTCNPKWPEITRNLHINQQNWERPDLINRVFKMKLESLLDDLNNKGILGRTIAYVHVVEFQKRGN